MSVKKFVSILVLLSCVVSASAQQSVNRPPTISVTGTAEILVVPDEVVFSLRVSKSDKSLQIAKTQNDENVKKILDLTRRLTIPARDVKTDFISVSEKFNRVKLKGDDEFQSVFAGYTISKTVVVKLTDISKFEEFFSEVIKIGVSQVSNVVFLSSQLRKYKDQSRAMAIRAAREKAEGIVKEIGQTIGKAVSIEEKDVDGYRSPNSNISSNSFSISDDSEDDADTLAIGTISVKAQVEVEFLLN